ncbi:MAG TPA: hypothetical protein VF292_07845 [Rhodanobacteraceae bacterium]
MFNQHTGRTPVTLLGIVVAGAVGLGALTTVSAAAPPTSPIEQAAQRGKQLFDHDQFGGVRTCDACHTDSGTGALSLVGVAAQFPKYNPKAHRVVTLEQQIANCMKHSNGGKAVAADSLQMADITAYLTKLSKGAVMGQQFN